MQPFVARVLPPLAGLLLLVVLLGSYLLGYQSFYEGFLAAHGIPPFRFPFLDTDANLSAWECARRGFDVIAVNPCDPLGRPYNYSPFWMTISFIPLGTEHRVMTGVVLDVALVLSLALLAPLRRPRDVLLLVAATWSTASVFVLDRGNADILLYLLLLTAIALLRRGSAPVRWAGYALIWLMAAIKYYPAVLLVFALRERRGMLLAIAGITGLLGVLFAAAYHADAVRAMALVPEGPPDVLLFGAKNLPLFVGRAALWLAQPGDGSTGVSVLAAVLTQMVLTIACLRRAFRVAHDGSFRAAMAALPERSYLPMVGGSVLLVGCFFATQNIVYRGIFFFPVLHGLLLAAAGSADIRTAHFCRRAGVVIATLMWADAIRIAVLALPWPAGWETVPHNVIILARELAWWWIVGLMGAILLDFLTRTELLGGFARRHRIGQVRTAAPLGH